MNILQSTSLDIYKAVNNTLLELPVINAGISAGFPSPAMDFIDVSIDMNNYLIKRPTATFYGRVKGVSMKNCGIDDGDLLVIDKSIPPSNNKIAVCYIDGEFTVKRINVNEGACWLIPENKSYKPIKITEDNDFQIWGIVTHVIKTF
ncbi:MAG: LexA family protein [Crocinitomicaceae bacterium]